MLGAEFLVDHYLPTRGLKNLTWAMSKQIQRIYYSVVDSEHNLTEMVWHIKANKNNL